MREGGGKGPHPAEGNSQGSGGLFSHMDQELRRGSTGIRWQQAVFFCGRACRRARALADGMRRETGLPIAIINPEKSKMNNILYRETATVEHFFVFY
jgi:hypothetical protein